MRRFLLLPLVALLGCPQTPWCDRLNPEQADSLRTCVYATQVSHDAPESVTLEDGSSVMVAVPDLEGGLEVTATSADGRLIATGSRDGRARVWDATTRRVLAEWIHPSAIVGLDFADDGSHLAVRMTGDLEAEEKRRLEAQNGIPHAPDGLTRRDVIAIWRVTTSR